MVSLRAYSKFYAGPKSRSYKGIVEYLTTVLGSVLDNYESRLSQYTREGI